MEKEVRKIVEERKLQHEQQNQQRKLTKDQQKEKFVKKLKKDSSKESKICIFSVPNLFNHEIRHIINKNAKGLLLNGLCLIPTKFSNLGIPSIIVIEGGERAVKFFKRLLMVRIPNKLKRQKKKGGKKESDSSSEQKNQEFASLVWEGKIIESKLKKWVMAEITTPIEGKKMFQERGLEHYWPTAINFHQSKNN